MSFVIQPTTALIATVLFGWLSVATSQQTNIFAQIAAGDAPGLVLSRETNSLRGGLFVGATNHVILVRNGCVETKVYFAMWNVWLATIKIFQ